MASANEIGIPPQGMYSTRAAMAQAINEWAAPRGYAFITGRSTRENTGRLTVTYACDRGGVMPEPTRPRQRRTTSKKTGCICSLVAKQAVDGTWSLKHRQDPKFAMHNHEPSASAAAHPAHRKFSEEEKMMIAGMTSAGVPPRQIRAFLRQQYQSVATQQDVYNYIAESRRQNHDGQPPTLALVEKLQAEGFRGRTLLDSNNRIAAVLFIRPESVGFSQPPAPAVSSSEQAVPAESVALTTPEVAPVSVFEESRDGGDMGGLTAEGLLKMWRALEENNRQHRLSENL